MNESKQKAVGWLNANSDKWFFLRHVAKELKVPAFLVRSTIQGMKEAGAITVQKRNEGMNRQWLIKRVEMAGEEPAK